MNFEINRYHFSNLFWDTILTKQQLLRPFFADKLIEMDHHFEGLRAHAQYNTGSIPQSTSILLALLARHFAPSTVAEVGTFIGRSTYALAIGATASEKVLKELHTCDLSNDINLNLPQELPIYQYPLCSSTDMFRKMSDNEILVDAFLIDGRLGPNDIQYMLAIMSDSGAIIMLDDFEGTEKGVANAFLMSQALKGSHLLIYPPEGNLLQRWGLRDRSTLALMIPKSSVKFVNQ